MASIFETIMLICFGCSWPIAVYKSIRSKSTKGKSIIFMFAILLGYFAGIAGKAVSGNYNYVLYLYVLNAVMVITDIALYFINKRKETSEEKELCKTR